MGSLPNLHELSKDKLESPAYRPAPIGGLGPIRLPAQPPPLAHTHRRARSSGHHHTLWDNDAMLEVNTCSMTQATYMCIYSTLLFPLVPHDL
ncbi:hypothetical protein K0M31_002537 [Melipona bicolor]|uniref:Uncharacterized protein n=1 Tax=Melipona bicolor TaxID=60889 RepID=A0AA40KYM3_9HYME|nr:hypothetical protein K0M31_002537 [Melipona bicolor]